MAKTDIVVQSNELIMLDRYDWTLQEQKIFLFLVSRVNSMKDKDFRKITLTVQEFAELIGVKNRSSIYTSLEMITDKILSRVFRIETEFSVTKFQALSRAKYIKKTGIIDLTIHQDMMPYLLEISKNFTAYELKNITKMTSSYALRTYELIKMYERLGEVTYTIENLRNKLGINAGEFLNFAHFNKHVLSIARREINSKTDLRMEYDLIKEGRKVTQVKFKVKHVQVVKPTCKTKSPQMHLFKTSSTAAGDIATHLIDKLRHEVYDNDAKFQSVLTDYIEKINVEKATKEIIKTEKLGFRKSGFMKFFEYLFKR